MNTVSTFRALFLASFLLGCNTVLLSQKAAKEFHIIEEIQSRSPIKSVGKDAYGYLWIANDDGLLRFDGYSTTSFFPGHFAKGFLSKKNLQFYVFHDLGLAEISGNADSVRVEPADILGNV